MNQLSTTYLNELRIRVWMTAVIRAVSASIERSTVLASRADLFRADVKVISCNSGSPNKEAKAGLRTSVV